MKQQPAKDVRKSEKFPSACIHQMSVTRPPRQGPRTLTLTQLPTQPRVWYNTMGSPSASPQRSCGCRCSRKKKGNQMTTYKRLFLITRNYSARSSNILGIAAEGMHYTLLKQPSAGLKILLCVFKSRLTIPQKSGLWCRKAILPQFQ